jgi:hypothetical protein
MVDVKDDGMAITRARHLSVDGKGMKRRQCRI